MLTRKPAIRRAAWFLCHDGIQLEAMLTTHRRESPASQGFRRPDAYVPSDVDGPKSYGRSGSPCGCGIRAFVLA